MQQPTNKWKASPFFRSKGKTDGYIQKKKGLKKMGLALRKFAYNMSCTTYEVEFFRSKLVNSDLASQKNKK